MQSYEDIFDRVDAAKPLHTWEANLPAGTHEVALVKYGPKISAKDRSVFLEAEFIVLSSNQETVKPGTRHSWPWFINKPDEYGYAHSRAKEFLQTVQKCIGNEEEVKAFGRALTADFEQATPQTYGLVLTVNVTAVTDAKGSPRVGKKGNAVHNAVWMAVPQDAADIAASSARVTAMLAQPQGKSATPVEPSPQTVKPKLGGLGSFLVR